MKIVIYEAGIDPFGILCSIFTRSGYNHGAIWNNGKLYDTSFIKGYFSEAKPIAKNRLVAVCDIKGDCQGWINRNLGVKYDRLGVALWWAGIHFEHKLFCFESVDEAVKSIGLDLDLGRHRDGGSIVRKLIDNGFQVDLMTGEKFNGLYL